MMGKYYTVDQVAQMIDMHPKTIRKFIREGKLRANKVGKQWRITGHDLSLFTEGDSAKQITDNSSDIEFTTDDITTTNQEKVSVSTVIDIQVINRDEAMRISNTLLAVMNSKDPKYGKSTMKVQFIEKDFKVRIMLWGTIEFVEIMLNSISVLTN